MNAVSLLGGVENDSEDRVEPLDKETAAWAPRRGARIRATIGFLL